MKGGSRRGTLSGTPRIILEKRDTLARNEAKCMSAQPRTFRINLFRAIFPRYYREIIVYVQLG